VIYRVFVEKRPALANEAKALLSDVVSLLGISRLTDVRLFNRYDVENIDQELFEYSVKTVFSEPQLDIATYELDIKDACVFAVEYLPGQFDQRADSAAQCIQIISQKERPLVRSAKVYALYGDLTGEDIQAIKKYVINPVESREASLDLPETLQMRYAVPDKVKTIEGFIKKTPEELAELIKEMGLAMDYNDILFCQEYFVSEKRDPTVTEIKMIDTYWSDHCRHTTFNTIIDDVKFEDPLLQSAYSDYLMTRRELRREKPICLMDIGTLAAKYLKEQGKLDKLDESEEINACTIKVDINVDGKMEPWLLLFKNETHNHPTEIEPFGGAATCIGGAIRDPLSGRSYAFAAMRLTGSADPLVPVSETIPGKLPQRKITIGAANGYSSYGNQIGLCTGIVDEIYHPGYMAKRMEVGAVIAAAPAKNVRRERPAPSDVVILLGGDTGRDGIGGATGSSKSHDIHSVENCGAEVQKGNAPEERKLQRLFRNPEASILIKKCNDFGAGGVSVAIGELAEGLHIDLDKVPKKYEGLDGTELAISESQERMAVVVDKDDVKKFIELAQTENLKATPVATVTDTKRLVMEWNGHKIVDISREFLDTNGAEKHTTVETGKAEMLEMRSVTDFHSAYKDLVSDLNICSKRGLAERFDSTIGSGSVLMPFGGKYQLTPIQAMVHKFPVLNGETADCSVMSWGYDPFVSEKSPYHGAYIAVVSSVSKLIATGADFKDIYLSFQEYFESLKNDPVKWGKPFAALLGAFEAQKELGVAAIGGKDSMSGSYEDIHVPPTLISFAVTTQRSFDIVSPEFKQAGNKVILIAPDTDESGLPNTASLLDTYAKVTELLHSGQAKSCYALGMGGIAEAIFKMAIGNGFGFAYSDSFGLTPLFNRHYGAFVLEVEPFVEGLEVGTIIEEQVFIHRGTSVSVAELENAYEDKLEPVFSCNIDFPKEDVPNYTFATTESISARIKAVKPKVLIPAFPGTNCEYDSARVCREAGCEAEIKVIKNLTAEDITDSVNEFAKAVADSQIIFIPGGFSGGDEPDGSGKFITAFFRNAVVKDAVSELLDARGGLMLGICNGFQALIKLGLVPFGKIMDTDADCPTLTFNRIARHQSKMVHTRVASNKSPWLSFAQVGDINDIPISHGEGRFLASEDMVLKLAAEGQIATQYVDLDGNATYDIRFNPNGSMCAIEGITSPDGRVFGKMGHNDRVGKQLYKNVPGRYELRMFEAAVKYFA
jgi:phosphoribosylformylglycinamidine synthase